MCRNKKLFETIDNFIWIIYIYTFSKEERIKRATQLFDWITEGKIKLSEPTSFKLSEGKLAHDFLESRKSTGKIILTFILNFNFWSKGT